MSVFVEISILLALTTVITIFVRLIKQPLVVGYIISGIIAGPSFLNVLHSTHELELFSRVGIVFLLFIVGLHLNPKVIKEVGSVSLTTGIGQVVFTSTVGFVISKILGMSTIAAIYVAIALTFSSTIIILKLLSDKRDLQKLYAKIAIGFLLVQDIVATIILIGVTIFSQESSLSLSQTIFFTVLKGLGIFVALLLFSKLLLTKMINYVAQSAELLFLFAVSLGIGLASLFALAGFSVEIGALIAGVLLSTTAYADEVASRMKPLRDFFIVIFFILLGSQLVISNLSTLLLPAFVLSVFVLIGNPVIVILIMNLLGYNRRTGFMAGLTVAQISEFSLILASLGLRVGHLSEETMSLITIVGLITIAGSTYLILYSDKIFPYMKRVLQALELVKKKKTDTGSVEEDYSAVIFGYDRVGNNFASVFQKHNDSFVVIDFNPESIQKLREQNIPCYYGDANDIEFLEELPLRKPEIAISTIPDFATNKLILSHLLTRNKKVQFIPTAHSVVEAKELYELGAAYVVMPHHLGAEHAARMLNKSKSNPDLYKEEKEKHLKNLELKYGLILE